VDARGRFGVLVVATVTLAAAYLLIAASFGYQVVAAGQTLAATLACFSCARAAAKNGGRTRVGWALLALSSAVWAASSLLSRLPYGGYVVAMCLAIAAVLTFRMAPAGIINRLRALLDGVVLAVSLSVVVAAFGFAPSDRLPLGYPVADLVLLTVIVLSARRASGPPRITLALLGAGYTLQLVADSTGVFPGVSRVGALLLVGLAAWWPADLAEASVDSWPGELWQLTVPSLGILAVIGTASWTEHIGLGFDANSTNAALAVGVLFVLSQVLAINESLRWLRRTQTAETALRARTELISDMIEHAPLGIARLSRDLRVLDPNARLAEMLGMTQRALAGSSLGQFVSPEDLDDTRHKIARMSIRRVERVEEGSAMRTADGREIWVHRVVTPMFERDGRVDFYLVMFEDETARHASEQAAMANLAGLERLSRLKTEFMSMVSHEFRTALTGIQGYSEVMKEDEVSPDEVKEFAEDINADALRLNRMIGEMLDIDRIESGRMQLHIADVDLNQLVRDAADRAGITTNRHNLRIATDATITSIRADGDRVTQVVSNLLSNAIKYSPQGGDIVVATKRNEDDVEVSVTDHGTGIPREFLSRIFGRYERFEGAGADKVIGTGLGLALAQQIVEMHKGRIWVESEVGRGSTFKFTIPTTLGVRASAAGDLNARSSAASGIGMWTS
jgi:PAS domain S-box-containing protein